jgi:hypothetical protein
VKEPEKRYVFAKKIKTGGKKRRHRGAVHGSFMKLQ